MWDRGEREAAGDGTTIHIFKVFQRDNIGNTKKRKPSG